MDGMTLLIFHIFAIGVIVATTAIIAYQITRHHAEWRRESQPHLGIKLLILQHKYFTICKYTPIYTPK